MAFGGYFIRFGNYTFPVEYIKEKSYKAKPNQRQNTNAYTDANGLTHTNPLPHTKTNISFTTHEMSGEEMDAIMAGIVRNYANYNDRNAICTYYDNENGTYKSGEFYLDQSLEFQVDRLSKDKSRIEQYGEMNWTFIEK